MNTILDQDLAPTEEGRSKDNRERFWRPVLQSGVVVALLLIYACSLPAHAQSVPQATLTFYRFEGTQGIQLHASVKIDGRRVHKLPAFHYWSCQVGAGEHTISGDQTDYPVKVNVEEGKVYFFRVAYPWGGGINSKYRSRPVLVPSEVAKSEMLGLKEYH